jgi:hypothetical protein
MYSVPNSDRGDSASQLLQVMLQQQLRRIGCMSGSVGHRDFDAAHANASTSSVM